MKPYPSNKKLDRRTASEQLADSLKRELMNRHAQPGEPIESIRHLARQYNVSMVTAGHALAILEGEGLIEKQQGRRTRLTDRMDEQHVAVLLEPDFSDPQTGYAPLKVAQESIWRLRQRGLGARLYAGHISVDSLVEGEAYNETSCPDFLQAVRRRQIRGVIAVGSKPLSQWADLLRQQDVPFVGYLGAYKYGAGLDYPAMVREGVRYLASQGRTRIAFMQWSAPFGVAGNENEKSGETFCSAMEEMGLKVDEAWVRSDLPPNRPGSGWGQFREMWTARRDKPDGLLVMDDRLMQSAAQGIMQAGIRIPDQLLVVSHANKGSGISYPFPVSEMVVDPREIAQAKVSILVRLMEGETVEQPTQKLSFAWRLPEGKKLISTISSQQSDRVSE